MGPEVRAVFQKFKNRSAMGASSSCAPLGGSIPVQCRVASFCRIRLLIRTLVCALEPWISSTAQIYCPMRESAFATTQQR